MLYVGFTRAGIGLIPRLGLFSLALQSGLGLGGSTFGRLFLALQFQFATLRVQAAAFGGQGLALARLFGLADNGFLAFLGFSFGALGGELQIKFTTLRRFTFSLGGGFRLGAGLVGGGALDGRDPVTLGAFLGFLAETGKFGGLGLATLGGGDCSP